MKRAVILSGGGSLGSYQVGVLTALAEQGIDFDVIAGVSVGALNGAMLAQDEPDKLRALWQNISSEAVHHKYSLSSIIYRLAIEKRRALYNIRGLRNLISENINIAKAVKPSYMGVTSLYDEQYYSLNQTDFPSNEQYCRAILASSLMPILWEPVDIIETRTGIIRDAVDGGLRNNTPLGDVLHEEPDEIYIIQCSTGKYQPKPSNTIVDVAKRTFLDIILSEVVDNDTRDLLRINELVQQAKDNGYQLINPSTGKPYKCYAVKVIRPVESLGNNLDFSREVLDYRFKLGYEQIKHGNI